MPQYKVKDGQKGFFDGKLYDSNGKRPILVTDKPLKPVPSWLLPIRKRSAVAAEQARVESELEEADKAAVEAKARKARAVRDKAAIDAVASGKRSNSSPVDDQVEKDAVTFTEGPKTTVETL